MAKAVGARVATSAGNEEKINLCKQLGADLVLNYNNDDIAAKLKAFAPNGVNLWYETQREPDLVKSLPQLANGGRYIMMAGSTYQPQFPPVGTFYPRNLSIHGYVRDGFSADE